MPKTEPLTETAIDALEARGIDLEIADRWGVQSIVPDRRTNQAWVMFPHLVGGQQVHWAARSIDGEKRFYQQPGGQRCLWNHDAINDLSLRNAGAPLIITEGHLDALSLMTAGFMSVTSVPDGAPGPRSAGDDGDQGAKKKYEYLAAVRDQLREWHSVILAVDADPAGDRLADDLARTIGLSRCRRMEYPAGCKDANDVLVRHGAEELVKCVQAAKWVQVGGIYDLTSIPTIDLPTAVRSGVSGVDDVWRFRPGELSVMVGIPNHGKSCLANHIGLSLAMNHNWVVAWFSPEQHPQVHLHRLLTCYLGKPPKIASAAERDAALRFIRDHVVWIVPERNDYATVDWLLEKITTVAWRYNCRMVIVDPWNQLDHQREHSEREDEYERRALIELGRVAVEASIHVMTLVHPRKPQTDHASGKQPVPTGYSIAGSAHWLNRPDLGATIYRDSDDTVLFRCWKARYADGEDYDNGAREDRSLRLNKYGMRYAAIDGRNDEVQ